MGNELSCACVFLEGQKYVKDAENSTAGIEMSQKYSCQSSLLFISWAAFASVSMHEGTKALGAAAVGIRSLHTRLTPEAASSTE